MQLKIVTHGGTFRYNQSGQPLAEITEPFVLVEVYTREDVVALYDQGREHLANAFTYQDDQITGISADAGDHIQNFFLAEGAWYLQELNPADRDIKNPTVNNTQSACLAQDPGGVTPASNNPGIFVPTAEQRQVLRDIQVTAEALRHIQPDPTAGWDRQVQKLLLSQQVFGIGDPEKACVEGQAKLEQLVAQAKASGVPANVVESNLAQGDVPEMEEEEP
ncbi:MAG: hypothetical protein IH623_10440 [Verrucomicrobia bacterium]|nr:hypothetical protein [Verrucomicrobiota bacterium]